MTAASAIVSVPPDMKAEENFTEAQLAQRAAAEKKLWRWNLAMGILHLVQAIAALAIGELGAGAPWRSVCVRWRADVAAVFFSAGSRGSPSNAQLRLRSSQNFELLLSSFILTLCCVSTRPLSRLQACLSRPWPASSASRKPLPL